MGRQMLMRRLARWHIWLGWLVGVPLLMWTVTGLVMAWRPIEVVRGEHLRSAPAEYAVDPRRLVLPRPAGPIAGLSLVALAEGPVWSVVATDGSVTRYAVETGRPLAPVDRAEAARRARLAYSGDAPLRSVTFLPIADEPLELRRGRASWRAEFADATRFYVDAGSGEILAVRTQWWRVFDFMYGLHIMNLKTRSDPHHPILIVFATLGVVGTLIGCMLMFRRRKPPRRREQP